VNYEPRPVQLTDFDRKVLAMHHIAWEQEEFAAGEPIPHVPQTQGESREDPAATDFYSSKGSQDRPGAGVGEF
jgi:hypothetical protein